MPPGSGSRAVRANDSLVGKLARRGSGSQEFLVVVASGEKPTGPVVRLVEESLTTLRSQPVGVPGG